MTDPIWDALPRVNTSTEIPNDPDLVEGRHRSAAMRPLRSRSKRVGVERPAAMVACVALVLFIGWLDHITGPRFPMGIAYVVPVAIAAWFWGTIVGSLIAGAAALLGLAATSVLEPLDPAGPPFWSLILRLLVLICLVLVTDFTHSRVRQTRARAEVADERVQQLSIERRRYEALFHAVAHDARGPLTTILGMAMTLERTARGISDEERDLLHRVATNAERLDTLLDDLLAIDRSHRLTLVGGDSGSLGNLIRHLAGQLEVLSARQIKITAGDERAAVEAPVIERIVENLLTNAARHTPPDSRIYVRVWSEGDSVIIAVEDDGHGVPPREADAIFLPHARGATDEPGHGIGLATVWSFADLYGGNAWVQERTGGGASFRVRLPASTSAPVRNAVAGAR